MSASLTCDSGKLASALILLPTASSVFAASY
jgi:hypothetical protein